MDAIILLALQLIELTGPDNQAIEVNPKQIITIREPRGKEEHFPHGTRCLLNMADGKIVVVQETCEKVDEELRAIERENR
jgi:uncharacterized protein YlzI (FlbEa/FlbD family)